ncbi:SIR2 family protein [Aminobacterium sp. MB27-C1]|uniref:SIR2 family protein n=1 Tax=Aminobacterium sp. MB27-C1 TaxID=3070661 RepID=UPI0027DAC323|nr:SIR2 family protein [Aminobacterium sp. MB27-C1]WMI72160.1 SIR2 family protein [Aminobacterium sp. MB27-C1]
MSWEGKHILKVGTKKQFGISDSELDEEKLKRDIESWLAAVFQSEHLSLLLGSGFTTAVATKAGVKGAGMDCDYAEFSHGEELKLAAEKVAKATGRGEPNIEDQIRVANILAQGLEIMRKDEEAMEVKKALLELIRKFINNISRSEQNIRKAIEREANEEEKLHLETNSDEENVTSKSLVVLVSFLLSFASRTATRERLNIFTTNYDRLIEYGADMAGLHLIDRFVGILEPVFRSSRLDIDMHYNPPGIRGEPRYLEGVVRFTKLHGSLDWIYRDGFVRKIGLPFGFEYDHPAFENRSHTQVMIYPNAAKDRETAEYPYVELFRDYAAAICRPNSSLVTYGYGFGDDHINRSIADMLTIPSTHLVIISHGDKSGRICNFYNNVGHDAQISLLIGTHLGDIQQLVKYYLPKPAIDPITMRQASLLKNRGWSSNKEDEEKMKNFPYKEDVL